MNKEALKSQGSSAAHNGPILDSANDGRISEAARRHTATPGMNQKNTHMTRSQASHETLMIVKHDSMKKVDKISKDVE